LELKKPEATFSSTLEVFEKALAHEKHITQKIYELYELAGKEKDYALQSFLKWYIDEQVEEESKAEELTGKVRMLADKGNAIFFLDKELGA
jgi:ferritin